MKKLLFILAAWLLPVSANAQSMRLDFDADAYYDPPAAAATAEQPATKSETSADKARTVRHGERTVMVANGVSALPGSTTKLAAQDPY